HCARPAGLPGRAPRAVRDHRRRPLAEPPEKIAMPLAPLVTAALAAAPADTAERVSHVYVQHLHAPPERVLPLLTPLGERAWASDWEPEIRWEPHDGGPGTLFAIRHPGHPETVWWMLAHDAATGQVRYVHLTPGSDVTEIDIQLRP